jgi:hypothetical protein
MSDFPIQKSAPDQLAGGQKLPLEGSDEQYSRVGYRGTQEFPLTGRPGTPVNNDQAASTVSPNTANGAGSRPPENISGMNAGGGRAISVKPVDSNNLEGSNQGDHRAPSTDSAKASLQRAANGAGGPRGTAGQFPNGKRDATLGSFSKDSNNQTFPGNTADSDAGN